MTPTQIATKLMTEAIKLGCDTPTEGMIESAIFDAVWQAETKIIQDLEMAGYVKASNYLTVNREIENQ